MKHLAFLFAFMVFSHICYGEKYQVLEINEGGYIVVNKKRHVKELEFFDDGDKLTLSANQVVAVRNVKTKRRSIIIGKNYLERGSKTLSNYFFPKKTGAVRGVEGIREYIGKELYWIDSLAIQTKLPPSIERCFVIEIIQSDGQIVERPLKSEKKGTRICFDSKEIWGDGIPSPILINLKVGTIDKYTLEGKYEMICTGIKLIPLNKIKKDEED